MTVRTEKDGAVWTVIIDRPEARNAVNPETAEALRDAFCEFEANRDAKVAVFYGSGGAFCAGGDLKYLSSLTDENFHDRFVDGMAFPMGGAAPPAPIMGSSRMEFTKPVIGAIEGPAVAGGMELALTCDMRVMGERAYMGVYCRRWGVPLIDGGTIRLPRLVGQGKALDIVLTGRKVTAQECERIGLCEYIVPDGETRAKAEMLAHQITRFPWRTVLADRRSVIKGRGLSVCDGLRLEWANGLEAMRKDGVAGAARFRDGAGRHGDYETI